VIETISQNGHLSGIALMPIIHIGFFLVVIYNHLSLKCDYFQCQCERPRDVGPLDLIA
jgi:hypothetical protein